MDLVTHIVKFNSQTSGRDKLCRLAQYSSKFSGWCVQEHLNNNKEVILRLKNLENALSATRKVLRFGKSLDMIQSALKSMQLKDLVLRIVLSTAKVSQAFYLLVDHLIWFGKVNVVETDAKKWSRASARFWLVTLCCNLIRNLYDLLTMYNYSKFNAATKKFDRETFPGASSLQDEYQSGPKKCSSTPKAVYMDTCKNVADLFLPLSVLGYVDISAGTQGLIGICTSLLGMFVIWNPALKLSPS